MAKKKTTVVKETPDEKTEVIARAQPEEDNHQDDLIHRVYLSKITGLEILEGSDAESVIKGIRETSNGDDTPYTFYEENGKPVYLAIKNSRYEPFVFPEPGSESRGLEAKGEGESLHERIKNKMGMTSMELYSKAVTLPSTIEKIIELETQPKPSLIDQAKKIMTPTIAIVACVLVIFLILVVMKG